MTAGVRGRRRSQGTGKLVVLSALAAVALLAPDVLEQAATSIVHILASIAFAAGELFGRLLLQPLVDGLQQSISDIQTPSATTPP
ncbi:MAG: hypothetical protein KY451_05045 [Actinobacteria bacterium]|nr:hypothetical protein [Actinomycetota bacterium]